MSSTPPITVTKIDDIGPRKPVGHSSPPVQVASAKKHKSMKTYPKGVLKKTHKIKIKPVADPAKSAPVKRFMRKHTIRLITEKGARLHRKTIKNRVRKLSDAKVKDLVTRHGLLKNPDAPVPLMREMLEGGMIAGFISLN